MAIGCVICMKIQKKNVNRGLDSTSKYSQVDLSLNACRHVEHYWKLWQNIQQYWMKYIHIYVSFWGPSRGQWMCTLFVTYRVCFIYFIAVILCGTGREMKTTILTHTHITQNCGYAHTPNVLIDCDTSWNVLGLYICFFFVVFIFACTSFEAEEK